MKPGFTFVGLLERASCILHILIFSPFPCLFCSLHVPPHLLYLCKLSFVLKTHLPNVSCDFQATHGCGHWMGMLKYTVSQASQWALEQMNAWTHFWQPCTAKFAVWLKNSPQNRKSIFSQLMTLNIEMDMNAWLLHIYHPIFSFSMLNIEGTVAQKCNSSSSNFKDMGGQVFNCRCQSLSFDVIRHWQIHGCLNKR